MDSPVIVVTPGEPAGIGPEIVLKLIHQHPGFRLLLVADHGLLRDACESLGHSPKIKSWQPGAAVIAGALNCLPVRLARPAQAGSPDPANAAYVLSTLRQAVQVIDDGHAAAMVTGPVHKAVINEAGIAFSGHTEFLAELSHTQQVVMMLAAPGLRVSLVTTHLPLRKVSDAISPEKVEAVIRITHASLRHSFGIASPRLQVLGLNPHAGEGGYLGTEDDQIIRPVIDRLRDEGMVLEGPVPADTAFTPPRIDACDAVVAMYHDQGLPVLKHMGFGSSVNITLGLPFVRTSVDHGTALDIAGSGKADFSSLHHAVLVAQQMARQDLAVET
jgi:4-hydroxythreonine-4-phosphate dehydrogenase